MKRCIFLSALTITLLSNLAFAENNNQANKPTKNHYRRDLIIKHKNSSQSDTRAMLKTAEDSNESKVKSVKLVRHGRVLTTRNIK